MKRLLTLCIVCLLVISSGFTLALDRTQTVRLGGQIIKPGTPKIKLLKYAGKPFMKEDTGISLNTGNLKEIWYYKYYNEVVMIYISGSKVRKVEFVD